MDPLTQGLAGAALPQAAARRGAVAIAGLLVLAAAGPLINQAAQWQGSGPLILVVDNGWTAAKDWPQRHRLLTQLTDQAAREGRAVTVVTTAAPPAASPRALTARLRRPSLNHRHPGRWQLLAFWW